MNRTPVVVLVGSGVGAEVAAPAIELLQATADVARLDVHVRDITAHAMDYEYIERIYRETAAARGVILRTSIHASICYRLRETFELTVKAIPITPLADAGLWRQASNIDVLLVRENCCGPYHTWNYSDTSTTVGAQIQWNVRHLEILAAHAFRAAERRERRVHLLIKTDVLGALGRQWAEAFTQAARAYAHVRLDILSPDTGGSLMLLEPNQFDVVATTDQDGDLLSDMLGALTYGTRGIAASANYSTSGFTTYQTLHGTGDKLKGKDSANPMGMMMAVALLLDDVAPNTGMGARIRGQIGRALSAGYRTADMAGRGRKVIGTRALGNVIVEAVLTQPPVSQAWVAAR